MKRLLAGLVLALAFGSAAVCAQEVVVFQDHRSLVVQSHYVQGEWTYFRVGSGEMAVLTKEILQIRNEPVLPVSTVPAPYSPPVNHFTPPAVQPPAARPIPPRMNFPGAAPVPEFNRAPEETQPDEEEPESASPDEGDEEETPVVQPPAPGVPHPVPERPGMPMIVPQPGQSVPQNGASDLR
jgi:hypothetical protein